jgi:hypothetical protein
MPQKIHRVGRSACDIPLHCPVCGQRTLGSADRNDEGPPRAVWWVDGSWLILMPGQRKASGAQHTDMHAVRPNSL